MNVEGKKQPHSALWIGPEGIPVESCLLRMVWVTGRRAQKHSWGKWERMQRDAGRTVLSHNVSLLILIDSSGGLKLKAFFPFFSSPPMPLLCSHTGDSCKWFAAYRKHCLLPTQLVAVQCSFFASLSLERWLFPSVLPRIVVLRRKPAARAVILTDCLLFIRRWLWTAQNRLSTLVP